MARHIHIKLPQAQRSVAAEHQRKQTRSAVTGGGGWLAGAAATPNAIIGTRAHRRISSANYQMSSP